MIKLKDLLIKNNSPKTKQTKVLPFIHGVHFGYWARWSILGDAVYTSKD